ncbi:MAG: RNA methyltransferase [Paraperlucidibaca sp.]
MNISTRIILVHTSLPANIGSTARAMKTMGLTDLVLVSPKYFPHADATSLASGASDILANARVVETLAEAMADCQVVLGTSARNRTINMAQIDAREAGQMAQQYGAKGGKLAFVFGREDRGLTNEELQLCHGHVFIPTNEVYGVLNVASAVQVLSYETRMAHLLADDVPLTTAASAGEPELMPITLVPWDEELVAGEDMMQFYAHLEQALVAAEFLDPTNPRQIMTRLRRLFGRTRLDRPEYNLLRGFFKRVLAMSSDAPRTRHDASASVVQAAPEEANIAKVAAAPEQESV